MRRLIAGVALALAACGRPPALLEIEFRPTDFELTDARAFRFAEGELRLVSAADYQPPHRSPRAIAVLTGVEFRSFTLDVEAMQTGREYGHRDLCLFFGLESAARFYYVHMATTPDAHAHNVFLVDGAPRRSLMPAREHGVDWGQEEWHRLRVARDVDAGTVTVYFDNMEAPLFAVQDRTIEWGQIGVGSFDDTGRFRNLVLSNYESRPLDASRSTLASD